MANCIIDRYGYRYSIDVDDAVMEEHYAKGDLCEGKMLDWIVLNVPKEGSWVDCGANVGEHSLVFATACQADSVFAFEPAPQNYDRLLHNLRDLATGNVIPLRMAVGAGPRLMRPMPGAQGRNSQYEMHSAVSSVGCVPVVSLDAIVPWKNVRLLKVDVEGMEVDVLKGARSILLTSRPEVFVEVWEQVKLDEIVSMLRPLGYKLIECWNDAPTFHFSASGQYQVTYTTRKLN